MAGMIRVGGAVSAMLAAMQVTAAAAPRLPRDAPYCARPGARQVFIAPMGEAFRADAGAPYPSAAWFAGADRDRDGIVDRGEFAADADRFFRTLDLDHDGRLVPEEVIAYERDHAPEIALYAGRRDPVAPPMSGGGGLAGALGLGDPEDGSADYGGPLGAGRYAWLNIPEPVASADADIDRVVSAAEFAAAATRRFDALDPRGTGGLRLAALARTAAQVAAEGPCRPRRQPRAPR